jgi:hypothetical protein
MLVPTSPGAYACPVVVPAISSIRISLTFENFQVITMVLPMATNVTRFGRKLLSSLPPRVRGKIPSATLHLQQQRKRRVALPLAPLKLLLDPWNPYGFCRRKDDSI